MDIHVGRSRTQLIQKSIGIYKIPKDSYLGK